MKLPHPSFYILFRQLHQNKKKHANFDNQLINIDYPKLTLDEQRHIL